MQMSDGEICTSFKQAKDQNGQISILAELNDCSTAEILEILQAGGCISGVPKVRKPRVPGGPWGTKIVWTPDMDEQLINMTREGLTPQVIAEKLGMAVERVRNRKSYLKKHGYLFDEGGGTQGAKGCNVEWTPEMDEQLTAYCEAGKGVKEIAGLMDLRTTQVKARKAKLAAKGHIMNAARTAAGENTPPGIPEQAALQPVGKVEQHMALCRELNALYERKNNDYGDSFAQTFAEEGMAMPRIRLSDKLNRFKRLSRTGGQMVNDETIRDTLADLANYTIMTIMEMDNLREVKTDD